jgi:predicted amidophosphoribosyltransferase
VVNILKKDPRKYIVPGDGPATGAGVYPQTYAAGAQTAGNVANSAQQSAATAAKVFCKNCGAELRPGSRFCEHCGAKNAPEFCVNCGTKLEAGSQFCGNCGVRV